ncbi:MAG: hypothetical protein C4312_01985 [Thermoflexus sp.]
MYRMVEPIQSPVWGNSHPWNRWSKVTLTQGPVVVKGACPWVSPCPRCLAERFVNRNRRSQQPRYGEGRMSVTAPKGFRASGVACGIKAGGALDLALVFSDRPCAAAGVFTTNWVKAAPVRYDQTLLARRQRGFRAVVINSGNANACTGPRGLSDVYALVETAGFLLGSPPRPSW